MSNYVNNICLNISKIDYKKMLMIFCIISYLVYITSPGRFVSYFGRCKHKKGHF